MDCVIGPGKRGIASISVNIPPLGFADCDVTVSRDFAITSVTPKNGSLAGSLLACTSFERWHMLIFFSVLSSEFFKPGTLILPVRDVPP